MDIYEFFESCKEAGLSGEEALNEYNRECEEYHNDLIEELEERSLEYAYQQDLIDQWRYER